MNQVISKKEITEEVLKSFPNTTVNKNWGEIGIFYNPNNMFSKGIYLMTFKEKDGENDKSSKLNRGNLYRLNIGITKQEFVNLFQTIPKRPNAGETVDTNHDFSEINKIMPHPVYGWMSWICIINPSKEIFYDKLLPFIRVAYKNCIHKHNKKMLTNEK